jgi:DNA repair protein RadC
MKGDPYMNSTLKDFPDNAIREEYARRFQKQPGARLTSPTDSAEHIQAFLDQFPKDQEHFVVVFMNAQNQIIETEVISSGSLATATVFPREIVKRLLALEAGAIIVAHNHPSGDTTPSNSDRALTKKLQRALEAIDVSLLDHLILANGDNYLSFSDRGLL